MGRITLTVDNRLRVRGAPEEVLDDLRDVTSHHNPQHAKLRALGLPAWSEPAIIRTWRDEGDHLSLPRGCMGRVRAVLAKHGLACSVVDRRQGGEGPALEAQFRLRLWGYQEDAIAALSRKENCLLRAPTGSGKSAVAMALAARLGRPTLVVVWSAALFDQWHARARKDLGLKAADIGVVRGSKRRLTSFTIGMQQTISKQYDASLGRYFGCVILDETQRAAAVTAFAAVDPFPARYRFGISASERRSDRKEFMTYDLFGDVAMDIPREKLVKSGHVLDVEVRVVPTAFEAPWYGMPDEGDDEREVNFDRLLAEMVGDEARERLVLDAVAAEVRAGEQVLVLSHRREHCMKLRAALAACGIPASLLLGGEDHVAELREGLARLGNGELRAGVGTYQAIGTGVDLPSVAVAVCATPIAGNEQFFNQVRGRVCRTSKGKAGARLYYLLDERVYAGHLKNLTRWNPTVRVERDGAWVDAKRGMQRKVGGAR